MGEIYPGFALLVQVLIEINSLLVGVSNIQLMQWEQSLDIYLK